MPARQMLVLRDIWAGALLAAFGVAALVFGADLAMGTARRMGPGYMPYGLAWLLVLCGAAVAPMRLRPFLGVLGGGVAFALVIDRGGILLASAGAILGAAAADRTSRWGEVATLAAVSMALAAILFVKLLGLNIPLWF